MTSRSVAEAYHEQTKYSPASIAAGRRSLDFDAQPSAFKSYPHGEAVDLTRFLPDGDELRSDAALAAWREALPEAERGLAELSHLLYFTNGVTGLVPQRPAPLLMRAAPSAGGLYPTELYLVVRDRTGLSDGIYNYLVRDHALVRVCGVPSPEFVDAACFGAPEVARADILVICTGVFARSAWRYEDRAYRRVLLDTGHVIGNMALCAPLVGHSLQQLGGFSDAAWEDALFLDPTEEGVLAVAALGIDSRGGPVPVWPGERTTASDVPAGQRLVALHTATRLLVPAGQAVDAHASEGPGPAARLMPGQQLAADPTELTGRLGVTILSRRSCRSFSGGGIDVGALSEMLALAFATRDQLVAPGLLQTWLVVHDVAGMEPGCYQYDSDQQLARQVRFLPLREPMRRLALGQDLAGDAAVVVVHTANLPEAVARLGDRAYRHLHMDAGHVGQRLSLGAVALGLGASGIGGFFDDEVNDLVGIPATQAVVYLTTLGVPERAER
ncbi:MAG: SagB/ThcOx family dehydrogenase [Candidatus Sericytochromatia bacterium]|nr:SagB/ThcOx family dehydrogenase [Candidatus Sericytochromatia bacterium]